MGGLLIAHAGGASATGGDVPAGVRRAIALGVDMVELDVRRTADGVLVVHHGGAAGERSLAGRRYAEAGRPALEDVLAVVRDGGIGVDLELKEAGYEREVLALAAAALPPERTLVTSFLDEALAEVRRAAPGVPTGLLVGRRSPRHALADAFPFARVEACGARFLAPSALLGALGLTARAAARGLPVLLWTVDDPRRLARALADERLLGVIADVRTAVVRTARPTAPRAAPG